MARKNLSSLKHAGKAGPCMQPTAGRLAKCCKPGKPRASQQSPPSTRFQPPRVRSDIAGNRGASAGAPLNEGHPRAGAQMQQAAWHLENPRSTRTRAWAAMARNCGRKHQRKREGRHHPNSGGGQSKPLSDFAPKVGITTHLARYHSFSLVPAPKIKLKPAVYDLPHSHLHVLTAAAIAT